MPEVREFIFLEADKPHRFDGVLTREALLEVFTGFDKLSEAKQTVFVTREYTNNKADRQGIIRGLRMHDEVLYASVEILDTPPGKDVSDYLVAQAEREGAPQMRLGTNAKILESKDGKILKLRVLSTTFTTSPE
jgi:hypothetical protein